ncbi:PTS system mannose/fructose/sorbose family transporter subunit IID [Vibrio penaeicida]|uniref:PTS N-acetylgalactosamine transporter subunit IID n=1 Tax=Vibrio penaeicida TaxID=104609 RepID=A0AAV5NN42_9VIBR|nr:PTS system mannose/fructose/sorbose family transporter subunit IID [Vibrio penaeicida]RTZ19803.1 PTS system mannose/fructose/sorbose family transporter subunit IID [Vibrio penaeicida]GLQ71779.1 PTS N-acetylgalactosamine transporter subunit IID [Vibrio penaeicida]
MTDQVSQNAQASAEDVANTDVLPKKVVRQILWRQLFLQASFNYERMQACGFLWAISPGLKHIHKQKERLGESMRAHMDFFNSHTYLVTFILGLVLAMEQSKQKVETIRAFKVAAMGPIAGVGDAMFNLTLKPISAAIAASLALDNVYLAPIFFLLLLNVTRLSIQIPLFNYGYKSGLKALDKIKDHTVAMARSATIVGIMVIGAMSAQFVKLKTTASIGYAETTFSIQTDLLDKIVPNILPVLFVLLTYRLLMKGLSPTKIIFLMILFGIGGHYIGVL